MQRLQPLGDVYQAGTFSGNPVTMAGGIEILRLLSDETHYASMEERTAQLFSILQADIDKHAWPVTLQRVGSMFAILFSASPVTNYRGSQNIDAQAFAKFFHYGLENGFYMPPSAVDAACVSAAHSNDDILQASEMMCAAIKHAFSA